MRNMWGHSYDECGCHGEHYHGHYHEYAPRWRCLEDLTPEERKEYLQEEKKILERRLKDVESKMVETGE
ncbi:MAG: DUF5320 domain-containing protein [Nitrososphaerota archaeon]|nr:DUF5320 domain-containing protein [Nitrososphaerota archaeon]